MSTWTMRRWEPTKFDRKPFCKNCGKAIPRHKPEAWDGESYTDEHFCNNRWCRQAFAYAAADAHPDWSTPEHKARVAQYEASGEHEKYLKFKKADARKIARKALGV